jgi:hypothetical protein
LRVIGYRSQPPNILEDSAGGQCAFTSLEEALLFLSEPYEIESEGEQKLFRVAWDIDQFIAPVLRLLPMPLALALQRDGRCEVTCSDDRGDRVYRLWYAREKGVAVTNKALRYEATIFHLRQFFPAEIEEPSGEHELTELEAYCRYLLRVYMRMGFQPKALYSPVGVLQPVLEKMGLPTFRDMPKEASMYAIACTGKPWHEAIQIGHWEQAWDYDLASAYPTVLAQCLDIRDGQWTHGKEYVRGALYGFCDCRVHIYPRVRWHPIVMYREDDVNICPTGTWDEGLSKHKIDLIRKWKLGTVDIRDGWWWTPNTKVKPLLKLVQLLQSLRYSKKEADQWDYQHALQLTANKLPFISIVERIMSLPTDRLIAHNAKAMLVGIFGYLGREKKDTLGPFYNAVYFSEATEQTACNVAEFLYRHKVTPIAIQTDGVLTAKEVPDLAEGWKLNYSGEALVLSTNGIYFSRKKPAGLYIEDVKGLILKQPSRAYWKAVRPYVLTLGDAVEWNEMEHLGEVYERRTSIDLNLPHDRHFAKLPRTGRELMAKHYMSRPYKIEEVQ